MPLLIECIFLLGDRIDAITKHSFRLLDDILETWEASVIAPCSSQIFEALLSRIYLILTYDYDTSIKNNGLTIMCGTLGKSIQCFPPNELSRPRQVNGQPERDCIVDILLQVTIDHNGRKLRCQNRHEL